MQSHYPSYFSLLLLVFSVQEMRSAQQVEVIIQKPRQFYAPTSENLFLYKLKAGFFLEKYLSEDLKKVFFKLLKSNL